MDYFYSSHFSNTVKNNINVTLNIMGITKRNTEIRLVLPFTSVLCPILEYGRRGHCPTFLLGKTYTLRRVQNNDLTRVAFILNNDDHARYNSRYFLMSNIPTFHYAAMMLIYT